MNDNEKPSSSPVSPKLQAASSPSALPPASSSNRNPAATSSPLTAPAGNSREVLLRRIASWITCIEVPYVTAVYSEEEGVVVEFTIRIWTESPVATTRGTATSSEPRSWVLARRYRDLARLHSTLLDAYRKTLSFRQRVIAALPTTRKRSESLPIGPRNSSFTSGMSMRGWKESPGDRDAQSPPQQQPAHGEGWSEQNNNNSSFSQNHDGSFPFFPSRTIGLRSARRVTLILRRRQQLHQYFHELLLRDALHLDPNAPVMASAGGHAPLEDTPYRFLRSSAALEALVAFLAPARREETAPFHCSAPREDPDEGATTVSSPAGSASSKGTAGGGATQGGAGSVAPSSTTKVSKRQQQQQQQLERAGGFLDPLQGEIPSNRHCKLYGSTPALFGESLGPWLSRVAHVSTLPFGQSSLSMGDDSETAEDSGVEDPKKKNNEALAKSLARFPAEERPTEQQKEGDEEEHSSSAGSEETEALSGWSLPFDDCGEELGASQESATTLFAKALPRVAHYDAPDDVRFSQNTNLLRAAYGEEMANELLRMPMRGRSLSSAMFEDEEDNEDDTATVRTTRPVSRAVATSFLCESLVPTLTVALPHSRMYFSNGAGGTKLRVALRGDKHESWEALYYRNVELVSFYRYIAKMENLPEVDEAAMFFTTFRDSNSIFSLVPRRRPASSVASSNMYLDKMAATPRRSHGESSSTSPNSAQPASGMQKDGFSSSNPELTVPGKVAAKGLAAGCHGPLTTVQETKSGVVLQVCAPPWGNHRKVGSTPSPRGVL